MDRERLEDLLKRVKAGKLDIPRAMEEMKFLPYQDLGFARLDHHRGIRQGTAEVVFGEGKSTSSSRGERSWSPGLTREKPKKSDPFIGNLLIIHRPGSCLPRRKPKPGKA